MNKARDWLTPKELNKIFTERIVKIRLWVCFEEKGVSDKDNILSDLRNKINESVGIILIDKGNVEVTHSADVLTVSIRPSYNKAEFYEKLKEDIADRFPKIRFEGVANLQDSLNSILCTHKYILRYGLKESIKIISLLRSDST